VENSFGKREAWVRKRGVQEEGGGWGGEERRGATSRYRLRGWEERERVERDQKRGEGGGGVLVPQSAELSPKRTLKILENRKTR